MALPPCSSAAIEQAEADVDEVDRVLHDFSVSDRAARAAVLTARALELTKPLDDDGSDEATAAERGRLYCVRGRALDLAGLSSAEEQLTRAVKLCDSSAAWNALGYFYWKRGSHAQAHAAFSASDTSAATLRNLSGVTRDLARGCNQTERSALTAESVAHARSALAQNVADGASWTCLAMALLADAFTTGGGALEALAPALKAFAQAERCGEGATNPDLLFNKAVLLRYMEDFQGAMDAFEAAGRLDDGLPWRGAVAGLQEQAARVAQQVALRCRVKPKRAAAAAEAAASCTAPGLEPATLAGLRSGLNPGRALACSLLATASAPGAVPVLHVAVDAAGACFALSLYGLKEGALSTAAPVLVLAPRLAHPRLGTHCYPLVRVHGPGGVLVEGAHPNAHAMPPQLAASRPR